MARPGPDLPGADAVRALADAEGRLALHVTPGARTAALAITDGRLCAKVREKPADGEATAAALALVAAALGIGTSRVTLLRGAASREKLLRIPV